MKDWEYTFDPTSREAWLRQIEADLKGKPAQSLFKEWWPGEPLIPFVHAEDVPPEPIRLPDSLFKLPPKIVEYIETSYAEPKIINARILDALKYGAQSILLHGDIQKTYFNSDWISDVIQEIVTLQIEYDNPTADEIHTALKSIPGNIILRLNRTSSIVALSELIETLKEEDLNHLSRLRFVYSFKSEGNWIEESSRVLESILSDHQTWKELGLTSNLFFEKCILLFAAGKEYFKQIIQTRALHLLWQNIKLHFSIEANQENDQYLETRIIQLPDENPDPFLIRASMSGLAASLSGTHSLCIHHDAHGMSPEFYSRINRDIHHLLNYESNMYKGTDPLTGAYAIQFYTRKWTEDIWKRLKWN